MLGTLWLLCWRLLPPSLPWQQQTDKVQILPVQPPRQCLTNGGAGIPEWQMGRQPCRPTWRESAALFRSRTPLVAFSTRPTNFLVSSPRLLSYRQFWAAVAPMPAASRLHHTLVGVLQCPCQP